MATLRIDVPMEVAIAFQLSENWRRELALELFCDAVLHSSRHFDLDEDAEDWLLELPDEFFVDPPDPSSDGR